MIHRCVHRAGGVDVVICMALEPEVPHTHRNTQTETDRGERAWPPTRWR